MDVYDIVDSVDIFAKYNDKWMEKLIALPKWNEKVSMLDELIKAASMLFNI
jgi:cytoskeleton-associated protein 5